VKAKTTLGDIGFVVEPVARGEIELGVQQITEILPVKGARLLGPLPASLQKITTYSIMLGTQARDPALASSLINYLTSAQAAVVFRQKGFSVP
jgi:molybdate transport system substrate-binding protein